MPRESDELSSRSKGIGIEGLGSPRPMLVERLVCQALERRLRFGEGSFPARVGSKLLKDRRRKLVLLTVGEAGGDFKRFPQGLRHCRDSIIHGTKIHSGTSTLTVGICAERRVSAAARLRAVGWMRLFGDGFGWVMARVSTALTVSSWLKRVTLATLAPLVQFNHDVVIGRLWGAAPPAADEI